MGQVEYIIKRHEVFTQDGFDYTMREVKHVPEGELHHLATYSPSSGYSAKVWRCEVQIAQRLHDNY